MFFSVNMKTTSVALFFRSFSVFLFCVHAAIEIGVPGVSMLSHLFFAFLPTISNAFLSSVFTSSMRSARYDLCSRQINCKNAKIGVQKANIHTQELIFILFFAKVCT
jgi:hypothetical protein